MSAAAARAASGGRDVEGEPRAPATAPQPPAHRALAPPGDAAAALPAAGKAARACGVVGLGGGGGMGSLVVVSGVARCPVKTAPPRPEQQQLLLQQQQQRPAAATAATAAPLGPAKALSDSSSAPPFIAESAANSSSSNNNSGGGGLGIVVGGATVTAAPAVAAEGGQGRTRGRKARRKKSGGRAKSSSGGRRRRSGRGRGGDDGDDDGDGGGGGSQVDHVKQLLLLHLDMMEEQQHQLQSKEKEIQALKTEKEALLSRLERMERRMLLARRDGEKNDQLVRRDRKEQLKERNEENEGLEGSPPEQPPRSPLSPQKATDQHDHKRAQSPGEHDPGPTAKKLAMESENESSQPEALTRTPSKPAKGRPYHGKNGRKFSRRKGWARCKALTALNSAAETTNADSLSTVCRLKNKTDKEDSSPVRESPEPCEAPEIVRPWERSKGVNRKKNSCVKSALPATPELTETDIGSPRTPWHKNKKKVNSNHLSHSPAELSSKNSKAKGGNRAALELDTPRPSQWSKGKKGSNSANHSPSSPAETSTPQSSRTKGGKASLPVCPKRSGWSKGGRARGKWRQAHASPAPGGSCSPLRACTGDDGRDAEEDPVLRTSEMYWCYQFQPPAVSMDEPILTEKDDTVAIPSWREIKLEPLDKIQSEYLLENTEDEAFNKRHTKHELDEKRRKRWDIQRIREQRQLQRLRERAFRKEGIPEPEPEMLSFFPEPEDVEELEVTPLLPVIAFGRALPRLLPQDFELPWLDDRTRQRLETPKKTSHGRGRCR